MAREWQEIGSDEMPTQTGRKVWIEDGTLGHMAALFQGEGVHDALADYIYDYESGRVGDSIEIRWHLYIDGKETDHGKRRFVAAR